MANDFVGYSEPASPNKKLASRTRTQGSDTVHDQCILIADGSGNIVGVTSAKLDVNLAASNATVTVDSELPAAAALGDSVANPTAPQVGAANELWDEYTTTWQRQRSNSRVFFLSSGARTTTQTTAFANVNWRGLYLVVNITSIGTGNITPKIIGTALFTSVDFDVVVGNPLTANGTYVYLLYPGAGTTAAAGITQISQFPLPTDFKLSIVANNANSVTYSAMGIGLV